jgi:uncharacterized RDD family membrane protein YckC
VVAGSGGDDISSGWSALINVTSPRSGSKQALHDLIAGTLVVKRGEQPATQPEPLEASA